MPQDKQQKWEPVYEALRRRIEQGEWAPGDRFPSEADLLASYPAVSRSTVRKVVSVLTDDGLLKSRHGSGTFVRDRRPMLGMSSSYIAPQAGGQWTWAQAARRHGMEGTQQTGTVEEVPAPEGVAAALEIGIGDPVVLRPRIMLLDGEPVEIVESYYPSSIARGTPLAEQRRIRGGSPAALAALGLLPVDYTETVTARPPTKQESRALALPSKVPVLAVSRTVFSEGRRPVEVCDMVMAGDRIQLLYEMPMNV